MPLQHSVPSLPSLDQRDLPPWLDKICSVLDCQRRHPRISSIRRVSL